MASGDVGVGPHLRAVCAHHDDYFAFVFIVAAVFEMRLDEAMLTCCKRSGGS